MSEVVRILLKKYGLLKETTHEDRKEIARIIEDRTGYECDLGAKMLSEEEFMEIVDSVLKKKKKEVEIGDILDEMDSYWAEQYEKDYLKHDGRIPRVGDDE